MTRREHIYNDDEVKTFNISDKIIAIKNNDTFLIEISFRELLRYCDSWSFNRRINDDKTKELYDTLCHNYDIPWTLHAVYDSSLTSDYKKILILDGQHRKKAIDLYINQYDTYMTCDRKVWMWIYRIQFCETTNSNITLDLFKKINNNRVFDEDELPNTCVIDLVNLVCKNKVLQKGIKTNDANNSSHSPFIHRKELNAIFNENIKLITSITPQTIVENMVKINHIISMKSYSDIYSRDVSNQNKMDRAMSIGFYLNLGKRSRYPITKWIKSIANPSQLL